MKKYEIRFVTGKTVRCKFTPEQARLFIRLSNTAVWTCVPLKNQAGDDSCIIYLSYKECISDGMLKQEFAAV